MLILRTLRTIRVLVAFAPLFFLHAARAENCEWWEGNVRVMGPCQQAPGGPPRAGTSTPGTPQTHMSLRDRLKQQMRNNAALERAITADLEQAETAQLNGDHQAQLRHLESAVRRLPAGRQRTELLAQLNATQQELVAPVPAAPVQSVTPEEPQCPDVSARARQIGIRFTRSPSMSPRQINEQNCNLAQQIRDIEGTQLENGRRNRPPQDFRSFEQTQLDPSDFCRRPDPSRGGPGTETCYRIAASGTSCVAMIRQTGSANLGRISQQTETLDPCPTDVLQDYRRRAAPSQRQALSSECNALLGDFFRTAQSDDRQAASPSYAALQARCEVQIAELAGAANLRLPVRETGVLTNRYFGACISSGACGTAPSSGSIGAGGGGDFDAGQVIDFGIALLGALGGMRGVQMPRTGTVSGPRGAASSPSYGASGCSPRLLRPGQWSYC